MIPLAFLLSSVVSGSGDEMGAKASLVEGPGLCSALAPSPTLENIQAAYEDGADEAARELIQQACCVECSAGMPQIDGVGTPNIYVYYIYGVVRHTVYIYGGCVGRTWWLWNPPLNREQLPPPTHALNFSLFVNNSAS